MRVHHAAIALAVLGAACTATPPSTSHPQAMPSPVQLTFTAEADSIRAAVHEYEALWAREGRRITQALETAAGLRFAAVGDTLIRVVVFEGASS